LFAEEERRAVLQRIVEQVPELSGVRLSRAAE
jgi:hypothetical protein